MRGIPRVSNFLFGVDEYWSLRGCYGLPSVRVDGCFLFVLQISLLFLVVS
jgi:hypothetical protein